MKMQNFKKSLTVSSSERIISSYEKKKKTNSSALQGAGKVQGPALEAQEFSCTELQAQNQSNEKKNPEKNKNKNKKKTNKAKQNFRKI
jgi:hypothetical protein